MRRFLAILAVCAFVVGVLLSGGLIQGVIAQQDVADTESHPIVGSWRETAYEEGIPPIELLTRFGSDGTISSAGVPVFVTPGVFNYVGSGVGVWEPVDDMTVAYTVELMLADADGMPAGRQVISGTRTVSEDGQTFTGEYTFAIVAPDGTVVFSSTGTDDGTRMTVQDMPVASPEASPEM